MPDEIQVGDIVWFDPAEPINASMSSLWPQHQPFVVVGITDASYQIKAHDGHPLPEAKFDGSWSFWKRRFRKDVFLSAVKDALAEAQRG